MAVEFRNTGVMCMVHTTKENELHDVDLGNYYTKSDTQERVLITSERLATKYGHLVKVPIYTRK
ncbi:hypothetical protein Pam2_141 [Pseudanabaena phage Pam2]|nr:hypothetical protein Pam2_141 [Pseudanabaena phage Pam2]